MPPSRRSSSRLAPPASPKPEDPQTDRPETPTPVVSSDSITSPPHSACRSVKSEKNAPDSPFTGFASNLQSLDSVERRRPGSSSLQPPTSPFTALASSLPNLNSSPGNFSTPGTNFAGNWPLASEPVTLGTQGSLLSPLSSWPLSGKVRRTLIGDDSAEVASVASEITSPKTPHMHIMCFGENEVTKTFTPTTVGSFGQFLSMSGSRKPIVLSGPGKSSATKRQPYSRRKLEENLECSESMPEREAKLSDLRPASTDGESGLGVLSSFSTQAAEEEEEEEEDNRRLSTGSMMSGKATPPISESKTGSKAHGAASASGAQKREAAQAARDPSKLCKCKKSKCVRQYCVCFRAGLLCEGCECNDCLNDGKHEEERKAAIDHIKTSDPLAFVEKIRPDGEVEEVKDTKNAKFHVRGCRCKNSRCLKRYCECFEHGVTCSAKCECRECLNGRPPSDGEPQYKKRKVGVAVPAARAEPLAAPIRVTSTRGVERKTVETRAMVGKDNIKVLPSAPETPHRADFQLSPVTPVQPVQASANLNFSKWTDDPTSLSPGFSLGQGSGSSQADTSPIKSEGAEEGGSPAAGFMLEAAGVDGMEMKTDSVGEELLAKGCAAALDEKTEMSICQDFGLVA